MNSAVRRSLVEALPRLRSIKEGQAFRDRLAMKAERRGWPAEILVLIEYVHEDRLDELDDRISDAEVSGDWDSLIDESHDFSGAPGFK